MPAPSLISSSPTNGASSVAKNASISLVFNGALLASTVVAQNFVLYNSKINQAVPADVSLDTNGTTVKIVPHTHLMPNCGHRIRVVGSDVNATTHLKAADSTSLAVTFTIVFVTNDSLETASGDKTEGQTQLEGDASLPDDISFKAVGGAPLRLDSTSPSHHAFKFSPALDQIKFKFSANLDASTVSDNITIRQYAFYEEDDFRAREVDLGKGDGARFYFRTETGYFNAEPQGILNPQLFRDRTFQLAVTGDLVKVIFEQGYEFPRNMCVEVTLGSQMADLDGNTLGDDFIWFGCTYPYPEWASIMTVRHETGHDVAGSVPDDFIGLRVWRATIDLLDESDWVFPSDNPSRPMMQYIRYKSAIDVWDDMLAAKGLAAGTSKRLGDLEINVTPAAGGARPTKLKRLEELLEGVERNIWYWLTQSPRIGIKSIQDVLEPDRGFFRDRLWRAEIMMDRSASPASAVDANTNLERMQAHRVVSQSYVDSLRGGWGATHKA